MAFSIRPLSEDDWEPFRDLRLRMLQDTPIAFNERYEDVVDLDELAWRDRLARALPPRTAAFIAIADDGTWIGIMRGVLSRTRGPMLAGVFVDPRWRGPQAGVADALLEAVIHWARQQGPALRLNVHADNPRAVAFYRRHGFVETGRSHPYELPPYGREIEMLRAL
ncbi:GNAT family N-acetyltransferase [Microbacterium sp. NPDC096154]|uniref:GNAT family N-acetyltransferase n=1 Tax=Microbacterium sp. NPDC096154 TaxID=3155549 RepID=UPI00331B8A4C